MKLEIEKLEKTIKGHQILKDLNLNIPSGKSIALIGPSGSGKSSLLKIIAGLSIPDSGSINIDDEPMIFTESRLRKHRLKMGIVFQSWNLFPHLTALENISLPLHAVHKMNAEEANERSFELLRHFNLERQASKKPFELSGGQAQRVAIIRAIAIKPKILLLDEPTSALDPLMTVEVLDFIKELKEKGSDLIVVTHHLSFAKKMSDWTVFIQDGTILEAGPTPQFFEQPKNSFIKNYLNQLMKY